MKAIIRLAAGYSICIAIAFSMFTTLSGSIIINVAIAETTFAMPMVIACCLALFIRRVASRRLLLVFEIVFSLLSLLTFVAAFTGEHDAQYQLAILLVPLIGFPAVLIVGAIAAALPPKAV